MLKNEFRFEGDVLIVVVERRNGERIEFKFDANDFGRLKALGKKLGVESRGLDLVYKEGGKIFYVKDYIMGFPQNRVSFTNQDNKDLRKSNLKCYGIRNKIWIVEDTLVVEVQDGSHVYFDASDFEVLNGLDGRINIDGNGYPQIKVDGITLKLHRFLLELESGHDDFDVADHIDGNVRNCRRSNLRPVTRAENNTSRHKVRNKFGFPHVSKLRNGKWFVRFTKFPEMNKAFDDAFSAIRYAHVVRPFVYGKHKGTVGSYENMKKAILQNGGIINEQ